MIRLYPCLKEAIDSVSERLGENSNQFVETTILIVLELMGVRYGSSMFLDDDLNEIAGEDKLYIPGSIEDAYLKLKQGKGELKLYEKKYQRRTG